MSTIEHAHRPMRRSSSRTPFFRTLTACTLGLFMVGVAYQSSFAQGGGRRVYGGGGGGGGGEEDNGGGLSTLEIAGIAVGGAALIALLAGAFHHGGAGAGSITPGAPVECEEMYPPLPADQTRISEVRLEPRDSSIEAGRCRCFYLNVRTEDGKWYSVTQRAETTIQTRETNIALTKMDGTKNIFCVPMSTPPSYDRQHVTVVGTFAPAGMSPYTAESTVTLRVHTP